MKINRMIKVSLFFLGCILLIWLVKYGCQESKADLGEFGDGTTPSDTIHHIWNTWDTLGFANDVDSCVCRRWYAGVLIDTLPKDRSDSCIVSPYDKGFAKLYFPFKAFDGTNYGQYTLELEWWKSGKIMTYSESYTVKSQNQRINDGRRHIWVSPSGVSANNGLSPNLPKPSPKQGRTACNGAGETGCVIHILPGNYPAAQCSTFALDSVNITIDGAGIEKTVLNAMTDCKICSVTAAGCKISNLTMLGGISSNSGSRGIIGYANADRLQIRDCKIDGFYRDVEFLAGCDDYAIYNSFAVRAYSDAIIVQGNRGYIGDCVIESLTQSSGADGIAFALNGAHNVTKGNVVSVNSGSAILDNVTNMRNVHAGNFLQSPTGYGYTAHAGNYMLGNHTLSFQGDTFTVERDLYRIYFRADTTGDSTENAIKDANKANFKATGFATSTQVDEIQAGLGWGDGWRQHFMPFSSTNKDSLRVYDGATIKATIYIYHTGSVVDSIKQTDW